MKLFYFLILFFCQLIVKGQLPIYLEDYSVYIQPANCVDTILKNKGKNSFKIYLYDCMGKMDCEVSLNGKIIEKGSYINSIDTFKQCVILTSRGAEVTREYSVRKYFHPLKDGEWRVYDFKKKKFLSKYYRRGIEIDKNEFEKIPQ